MQTTEGATPLMYACQQCREHEVLDILRKQPYSVKDRDRTFKTPLHYCAENANTSCAEALLKIAPESVNAQDENGYCTLHLAVIAGNKSLIKLLIAKGADINVYDKEGHSAVHWAIVSSEKEALEMIICAGANPSTPDVHGGYPLHYAVQMCGSSCDYIRNFEDTVKVVETLLSFGVNVNVKDKDGRQPILWAASAGSADAIVHLIAGGACVEASDKDGLTALHCAASRGHTTTLDTLITLCGANVDVIDGNGCSALFYAVTLGHADATELLLKLGAEPNRQDRKGRTPAHCGAAKGQLETLRILQKHGGNLWLRNVRGDIPLHEAIASGRKDLVLWLLSQNSEAINVANNDGRCSIHIASMYNNTDMVKVLLDAKSLVNPVMRTSKGVLMTPLNVALCKGHRSCGKFLQLHGGVPFSKVSKVETNAIYAVRISPSDDMMNKLGEATIEPVTPSHGKISTNRSSADSHVLKVENADKKKVYRRRKKKKNSSNVDKNNSDTDSEDNYCELKSKVAEIRKNGRISKNYGADEVMGVRVENKKVVIEKYSDDSSIQISVKESLPSKKEKVHEEAIAAKMASAAKTEAKALQRNKSFSETKNVSDLSPEDFPPMMQSVKRLDADMMEAEVEMSKALGEGEVDTLKMPHPKLITSPDSRSAQKKKKKEDDFSFKEKNEENIKITPSFTVIETDENEKPGSGKDVRIEETGSVERGKDEKSVKVVAKRSNGVEKKVLTKSPGSSGTISLNEENLTDRGENQDRSSNSKSSSSDGGSVRKEEKLTKAKSSIDRVANGNQKFKKSSSSSKSSKSDGLLFKGDDKFLNVPGKKIFNVEASPGGNDKPEINSTNLECEASAENKPEILITDAVVIEETTKASDGVAVGGQEEKPETKACDDGALGGGDVASVKNFEPKTEDFVVREPEELPKIPEIKSVEPEILFQETPSNFFQNPKTINPNALPPDAEVASEYSEIKYSIEKSPVKKGEAFLESTINGSNGASFKNEAECGDAGRILVENFFHTPGIESETSMQKDETLVLFIEDKISFERIKETLGETEEAPTELVSLGGNTKPQMNFPEKGQENSKKSKTISPLSSPANEVCFQQKEVSGPAEDPPADVDRNVAEESEEKINSGNDSRENLAGESNAGERSDKKAKSLGMDSPKNDEESLEENLAPEPPSDPFLRKTNEWMAGEQRHHKAPRVSRLCRRRREFTDDVKDVSVTQLVQNTIRKYHMERGIFYQLLELKRLQIRAGRANEQVLVKRLADEYERSRVFSGMKHFSGFYKFREFEKFLYDQLKDLNRRHSLVLPEMKSYDDIDTLSDLLKKSRYKIISEISEPKRICTCITQRCHHSAHAYTSVPCSAYVTDACRLKSHKPKKECFFPRIEQSQSFRSERQKVDQAPATLELFQGNEKRVINLPQTIPDKSKRYYVTFTIKGSSSFKEKGFFEDSKEYFKHRHAKSV